MWFLEVFSAVFSVKNLFWYSREILMSKPGKCHSMTLILTWCALIKKDVAYSILNVFWIGVGIVGIARALGPVVSLSH